MSSTYGLICLNHDPGIEIGDHTIDYQPDSMLALARNPTGDWSDHARCDLVVAAYSYPIARIACPGQTENGVGCRWHNQPRWVEAEWLRLLIAAYQADGAVPEAVMEPFASRCWKRERALRLAPLLGVALSRHAASPRYELLLEQVQSADGSKLPGLGQMIALAYIENVEIDEAQFTALQSQWMSRLRQLVGPDEAKRHYLDAVRAKEAEDAALLGSGGES